MLRVFMVLEDYGELMFLQTVLKKIGFDVDGIQNPRAFADHALAMNPDVVVMTAHGKKVKGLEMARTLKRVRGVPRVILIQAPGTKSENEVMVDRWLTSPVGAVDLLNAIGDLCGLNKEVLADKFQKLRIQDGTDDEGRVLRVQNGENAEMAKSVVSGGAFSPEGLTSAPGMGGSTPDEISAKSIAGAPAAPVSHKLSTSSLSDKDREARHKAFLQASLPPEIGFSVKQVQEQVKALRKEEKAGELADLERERKAFVEHLFRKK